MSELLRYFQSQKQAMVDLLTDLVNYETPTTDKASVDRLGTHMEQQFRALGAWWAICCWPNGTTLPQANRFCF